MGVMGQSGQRGQSGKQFPELPLGLPSPGMSHGPSPGMSRGLSPLPAVQGLGEHWGSSALLLPVPPAPHQVPLLTPIHPIPVGQGMNPHHTPPWECRVLSLKGRPPTSWGTARHHNSLGVQFGPLCPTTAPYGSLSTSQHPTARFGSHRIPKIVICVRAEVICGILQSIPVIARWEYLGCFPCPGE